MVYSNRLGLGADDPSSIHIQPFRSDRVRTVGKLCTKKQANQADHPPHCVGTGIVFERGKIWDHSMQVTSL